MPLLLLPFMDTIACRRCRQHAAATAPRRFYTLFYLHFMS